MTQTDLTLISHHLCPYVQRAAIALAEKEVPFDRKYIDLSNKPAWFTAMSPLGKVPVLQVGDTGATDPLFESSAILEYIEDTAGRPLHPSDAIQRARHRGWIEFGSNVLNTIGVFYSAKDTETYGAQQAKLRGLMERLEAELEARGAGPYFDGARFSLVDTVFAPVFRYFNTFEQGGDLYLLTGLPRIAAWRMELAKRPSVQGAVHDDFVERLQVFMCARQSVLGERFRRMSPPPA